MSTYAIGDVQGCYRELVKLLELISFNPQNDTLWLTGDLVNRGSHSLHVLRFIKNLGEKHITVLGNHDLHFLAVAMKVQPIRQQDTFQDILKAKDLPELVDWLRFRPLLHDDPTLNFTLVHAGIYPWWSLSEAQKHAKEAEAFLQDNHFQKLLNNLYGNQPDRWAPQLAGFDRYRFIINAFARMRFCTLQGRLNMVEKCNIGKQPAELYPWFTIKNLTHLPRNIVFGHWASLNGVTNTPHIYAIDTGCVWKNRLTALRLEDKKLFSIQASRG